MESRHLEVEHRPGVLGVDEVVGHRLIDGHGNGAGAIGAVAAVDGDGLVVHAPQSLLLVTPASQLAYSPLAVSAPRPGRPRPDLVEGERLDERRITLAPDDPLVQGSELRPSRSGATQ